MNTENLNENYAQKMYIEERAKNDSKNIAVTYALWFFVGMFGAHRFYMKQKHAVTQLVLSIVGLVTSPFLVGIIPLLIVMVWMIFDAIKIPQWHEEERTFLRRLLTISEGAKTSDEMEPYNYS